MKKIFTLLIITISLNSFGQVKYSNNYLLLRFIQRYDHSNKRDYFVINAEAGCDSAKEVYSLVYYNNSRSVVNTNDVYSYNKKDTSGVLFNYFLSPTEGINYMSKKGWTLNGIFTEVFGGTDYVISSPVFCFVKN